MQALERIAEIVDLLAAGSKERPRQLVQED